MKATRKQTQRGSAVVEIVFIAPFMLLLFLGVCDFSLALNVAIDLSNAAFAGAQFGTSPAQSSNTTGMKTAATNDAKGIPGFTVTASKICTCTPGNIQSASQVSCSSTCTGYGTPAGYVQVQASATVKTLFPFAPIPATLPVSAIAILRVQ